MRDRLLPFDEPPEQLVDPLSALTELAPRLAAVIEATARRRDVRAVRARLVLLVLHLRCPTGKAPRRRWYVPGGVARLGAEGLRRRWEAFHGEPPPSERTIRAHLGALELAAVLVRAPGDWIPTIPDAAAPHRRPRYADTIELVDTEEEAAWWASVGRELLESDPGARQSPARWRMLFGSWRDRARVEGAEVLDAHEAGEELARSAAPCEEAPSTLRTSAPADAARGLWRPLASRGVGSAFHGQPSGEGLALAERLRALLEEWKTGALMGAKSSTGAAGTALAAPGGGVDGARDLEDAHGVTAGSRTTPRAPATAAALVAGLDLAGLALRGRPRAELALGSARDLRFAITGLAIALERGNRVRNPHGWLVNAVRRMSRRRTRSIGEPARSFQKPARKGA